MVDEIVLEFTVDDDVNIERCSGSTVRRHCQPPDNSPRCIICIEELGKDPEHTFEIHGNFILHRELDRTKCDRRIRVNQDLVSHPQAAIP